MTTCRLLTGVLGARLVPTPEAATNVSGTQAACRSYPKFASSISCSSNRMLPESPSDQLAPPRMPWLGKSHTQFPGSHALSAVVEDTVLGTIFLVQPIQQGIEKHRLCMGELHNARNFGY